MHSNQFQMFATRAVFFPQSRITFSYTAVTVTFDEGILKVVAALFLSANVTEGEEVHSLKRLPVKKLPTGGVFALMVTVWPSV